MHRPGQCGSPHRGPGSRPGQSGSWRSGLLVGIDELEEEQQPWLRVGQMQSRGFPVSAVCQSRLTYPEETLGGLCVRQTPYLTSYSGLRVGRDDVVIFLQQ